VANHAGPPLAASLNGILVGATIVATRLVIGQTSPAALALLRYSIGLCCLLPPLLLSARVPVARRDLLPISLLGVLQFGVVVGLLNYAVQFIPSARAALIFATFPLLTLIIAAVLGYERLTWAKGLGVVLSIAGVAFALGEKSFQSGSAGKNWIGELAVFGSAVSGAVCSVLYRPYLQRYPALPVSVWAMLASVLVLALVAAGEGFFNTVPHFTAEGWLAVVFVGVSSGVGYYLWLWALGRTSPTRVTVFLALSPVTATLLEAAFLSERVSLAAGLGLLCVAGGLWLAHRKSAER
jgi:drug/metabolite transporter (DMT)-like permease